MPIHRSQPFLAAPLLAGLVVSGAGAGGAIAQTPDAEPTFTEHVAPIVFEHCARCHRPGEIGPFPLTDYDEVRRRAQLIVKVTETGFMPPWHPVDGHGEFLGAARLAPAELETLRRWVAAGRPEGDPAKLPPFPDFPDGWQLGEPDLVVSMSEGFPVPAGGPDIYRSFVVPLGLDADRWLTAIEVRAGARSVLHHIIFAFDTTGDARRRDAADPLPGFDGMREGSNLGESTAGLGGWAVGGQPQHLPLGLAVRVPAGADLVLRSHLHPSGKEEVEQTTLGLFFTDEPPQRTAVGLQMPPMFGVAAGLDVPAGESDFTLAESFVLPVDALALTVGGHAHMICEEMQVEVTPPDGATRSIFWIDDWDFDWQNRYQYREPVELPAGTRVDVRIRYDNSKANPDNPFDPPRRIRWGLQSTDEMGSLTLLLVAADEADTSRLERAVRDYRRAGLRGQGGSRALRASALSRLRMLDRDGDGRITADEIPDRGRRMVLRLDTNGDGVIDADEMRALEERLERRGGDR